MNIDTRQRGHGGELVRADTLETPDAAWILLRTLHSSRCLHRPAGHAPGERRRPCRTPQTRCGTSRRGGRAHGAVSRGARPAVQSMSRTQTGIPPSRRYMRVSLVSSHSSVAAGSNRWRTIGEVCEEDCCSSQKFMVFVQISDLTASSFESGGLV